MMEGSAKVNMVIVVNGKSYEREVCYEGELCNNIPNGKGRAFLGGTDTVFFEGPWKDGKPDGYGKGAFLSNSKYDFIVEGTWKGWNMGEGKEICVQNGITIYEGEFREFIREGYGKGFCIVAPEIVFYFEGEWKSNVPCLDKGEIIRIEDKGIKKKINEMLRRYSEPC